MNSIFMYIFLGVSLAAPIGPVNAAQLNTGIKNGFFPALIFGMGALTADVLYMVMVYFGVGQFIDLPFMKTFLWSFGCFVLTYTGIESLFSVHKMETILKGGKRASQKRLLMSGFLMSLLNPLSILFWLGIYGSIMADTAQNVTVNQFVVYSFAIILGILLWDFVMAFVSSGARNLLSTRVLVIISLVSALSMIGFGIYFGIQAWQELFLN